MWAFTFDSSNSYGKNAWTHGNLSVRPFIRNDCQRSTNDSPPDQWLYVLSESQGCHTTNLQTPGCYWEILNEKIQYYFFPDLRICAWSLPGRVGFPSNLTIRVSGERAPGFTHTRTHYHLRTWLRSLQDWQPAVAEIRSREYYYTY